MCIDIHIAVYQAQRQMAIYLFSSYVDDDTSGQDELLLLGKKLIAVVQQRHRCASPLR